MNGRGNNKNLDMYTIARGGDTGGSLFSWKFLQILSFFD